jgi:hypothetical protein
MRHLPEAGTRLDVFRLEKDERREVFQMISRLPRRERVRFLAWACRAATLPGGHAAAIEKTSGEARDVYGDLMMLWAAHNLSVRLTWDELVRRCRRLNVRG